MYRDGRLRFEDVSPTDLRRDQGFKHGGSGVHELMEMGHVHRHSPPRSVEVLAEAWPGEIEIERPLSAGGTIAGTHSDGFRRAHRPGSAVGLRNEVGLSRLQAQVADLQSQLGNANREVQRLHDLRDAAEAEVAMQRSLASTAKAQVAKLQQQMASRVEIQVLEEKLRSTEESRASIESEREEERQRLLDKVAAAETRAMNFETELKRQRLAQDDTRALADKRCRETEERCKSMQSLMDDVTRSASAEMDAAAERVREFQADLESWQVWAEEEKEQRKELAAKVSSKDVEVQHLLQQLHLANSQVESLHLSAAELRQEMDFQRQQYERKMNQYKTRVETELQDASARESELEMKLQAKTQECDRLGQEASKTKGLQAKVDEFTRRAVVRADLDTVADSRVADLERQMAAAQLEHEHQVSQHLTTKARLEATTAKAQDFEVQCQTLSIKLDELQARSADNDRKFDRQLALHREELCTALSRVQELERQLSRQQLEEGRLEQELGSKTRELQELQLELVKCQDETHRTQLLMKGDLQELQLELVKCQEDQEARKAEAAEKVKEELQTSQQELERERVKSASLEKKREDLEAQLQTLQEEMQKQRQQLEARLQTSEQEFDRQREQLEAQLKESKLASEELEQESTRFSELDTQREQLEAQLQASKQAVQDQEKEKQQFQAQLRTLEQELEKERARFLEMDGRRGQAEAQLLASKQAFEEQTDAMDEARAHVEGLSNSLKESKEKCDALWLRKQDLELKLNDVQSSATEQITLLQEQLKESKDAQVAQDLCFRQQLADLGEAKRQVAELQQMIKERDADIENYEEMFKGATADQVAPAGDPLEGSFPLVEERPKVVLHLEVAKSTLSPTSGSSPCAPHGGVLMRSKALHQGVSVQHIGSSFVEEVTAAGCSTASSIQDLELSVVMKLTAGALCPLDGQLGAAYVHGLPGDQHCAATHVLSYSSETSLQDIVGTLQQHCNEVGTSSSKAFIWIKALCWNLHRHDITDPAEIRAILDERIRTIGHVLVLLTPWDDAHYFQRRWCVAEMEVAVALSQEPPEDSVTTLTMLTPLREVERLGEAICQNCEAVPEVWRQTSALPLDPSIAKDFRSWIATTAETWLRQRLAQGSLEASQASVACDTVGWLLREVSLHHRAAALLQDSLQLALCGSDNVERLSSPVLCCLGTTVGPCCDQADLLQSCDTAIQAHQQKGTLETMAGMELLSSFGAAMWMSGDPEGAARALQQAVFIRVANRTLENPQGAMLLRNFGVMKWATGFHKESLELFEEAKRVRKCIGCFTGPHAAVLMMNMGYAKAELGDFQGSLEAFHEVLALLTVGSASSSMTFGDMTFALPDPLDAMPCGATLISSIAVAKGNLGRYDDALRAYSRAQLIRKSTGTMCSPAGAVLMRNKGMAHFGHKEYADSLNAYLAAKDIRKKNGTMNTYAGANLLSNLASARAKTGDVGGALEDCQNACELHKEVGTLQTPGGQAALKQLKDLKRSPSKAKEEAPQSRRKGGQMSKDKTLKTPSREKAAK